MWARVTEAVALVVTLGPGLLTHGEWANAKVLRWDLQNVAFDDGSTARGYFLFDADVEREAPYPGRGVVSWDIEVGVGPKAQIPFPPFRFTPDTSGCCYYERVGFISRAFYDYRDFYGLSLEFTTPLSNSGGTVALHIYSGIGVPPSNAYAYYKAFKEWTYGGPRSYATAGEVVAVPEASAALLLAFGLAALAVIRVGTAPIRASNAFTACSGLHYRSDMNAKWKMAK